MMETTVFNPPQTKQCPFCAETIQARAIKCRFCNEFLNTNKAKTLQADAASDSQLENEEKSKAAGVLFIGKPSLWAMSTTAVRGLILLALGVSLIAYPLENLSIFQQPQALAPAEVISSDTESASPAPEAALTENTGQKPSAFALNERQISLFRRYRILVGLGLAAIAALMLLTKIAQLKATRYEVSIDRIEWSRGLLDRKVDNLDMFRVIDLKLRRSMLDCIVGVGTVTIMTTDKSDPEFTFEKIRNPRKLYEAIKKASLDADRRSNAIHIE